MVWRGGTGVQRGGWHCLVLRWWVVDCMGTSSPSGRVYIDRLWACIVQVNVHLRENRASG